MESIVATAAEEEGSGLVFLVHIRVLWTEQHLPPSLVY